MGGETQSFYSNQGLRRGEGGKPGGVGRHGLGPRRGSVRAGRWCSELRGGGGEHAMTGAYLTNMKEKDIWHLGRLNFKEK